MPERGWSRRLTGFLVAATAVGDFRFVGDGEWVNWVSHIPDDVTSWIVCYDSKGRGLDPRLPSGTAKRPST